MFIRIILLFLQFSLIKSFNFPKIITSALVSSSLLNSIHELVLPETTSSQVINNKLELPELPKIKNDENNAVNSNIKVENNNIYFYGPITSESCKELSEVLTLLDTNAKIFSVNFGVPPPTINLHIQSEGGALMNAFYVVDLINNLETPVHTYVDGYVASAGSLISVMGKKRFMTKNSFILIHQLSSSSGEGKFDDLDDNMENLNKFMDTIKNIYLQKTKIPVDNLKNILEHDLWMDSKECLELGIVDEII